MARRKTTHYIREHRLVQELLERGDEILAEGFTRVRRRNGKTVAQWEPEFDSWLLYGGQWFLGFVNHKSLDAFVNIMDDRASDALGRAGEHAGHVSGLYAGLGTTWASIRGNGYSESLIRDEYWRSPVHVQRDYMYGYYAERLQLMQEHSGFPLYTYKKDSETQFFTADLSVHRVKTHAKNPTRSHYLFAREDDVPKELRNPTRVYFVHGRDMLQMWRSTSRLMFPISMAAMNRLLESASLDEFVGSLNGTLLPGLKAVTALERYEDVKAIVRTAAVGMSIKESYDTLTGAKERLRSE